MAAVETGDSKFLPLACPQPGVNYPRHAIYCGGKLIIGY
jgi:hypothetical protein